MKISVIIRMCEEEIENGIYKLSLKMRDIQPDMNLPLPDERQDGRVDDLAQNLPDWLQMIMAETTGLHLSLSISDYLKKIREEVRRINFRYFGEAHRYDIISTDQIPVMPETIEEWKQRIFNLKSEKLWPFWDYLEARLWLYEEYPVEISNLRKWITPVTIANYGTINEESLQEKLLRAQFLVIMLPSGSTLPKQTLRIMTPGYYPLRELLSSTVFEVVCAWQGIMFGYFENSDKKYIEQS